MKEHISVSMLYRYKIVNEKEGGMGRIYILEKPDRQPKTIDSTTLQTRRMQDKYKFLYRDFLAAKSVKSASLSDHFLRELNIWITLSQPGIVPLLRVVRDGDELLGIMPAYESNLREYLAQRHGRRSECLKALWQAVKGLEEASENGVLHLDLKPENLLVTVIDGTVQIDASDWGIANIQSELAKHDHRPQGAIQTLVGIGTVPYMSPERLAFAKADVRSDVFSLGLILYEVLLGELPYDKHRTYESQILSGQYMDRVQQMADTRRIPSLLVRMLHPNPSQRTACYNDILKFLANFKD